MNKNKLRIGNKNGFIKSVLTLFINFYNIKENEKYSYIYTIGNSSRTSYSDELVNFIIDEIKKNKNNFVESLKVSK